MASGGHLERGEVGLRSHAQTWEHLNGQNAVHSDDERDNVVAQFGIRQLTDEVIGAGPNIGRSHPSALKAWHQHCLRDEARQAFVIPEIEAEVNRMSPGTVVDLGARTGYLVEALAANRDIPSVQRFELVDEDENALKFAEQRLAHESNIVFSAIPIENWHPNSQKEPILYLLAYTLLELSDMQLDTVFGFPRGRDRMLIVVPDVREDLPRDAATRKLFDCGAAIPLDKRDWGGQPYPFIARSVESWLDRARRRGLDVHGHSQYCTANAHRHFRVTLSVGVDR